MKYFDNNTFSGEDLIILHDSILRTSRVVASNLFFCEAKGSDSPLHREKLAASAYSLIGICEAIIDRVPEDEAARALEVCRDEFDPGKEYAAREAAKKIVDILFGRF